MRTFLWIYKMLGLQFMDNSHPWTAFTPPTSGLWSSGPAHVVGGAMLLQVYLNAETIWKNERFHFLNDWPSLAVLLAIARQIIISVEVCGSYNGATGFYKMRNHYDQDKQLKLRFLSLLSKIYEVFSKWYHCSGWLTLPFLDKSAGTLRGSIEGKAFFHG